MALTPTDHTLLTALTSAVRLATTAQTGALIAASPRQTVARLGRLERRGWLLQDRAVVRVPPLPAPLVTWQPGREPPRFTSLAYRLDARWAATEPTPCRVWWATPLAVAEFGGVGGRVRQALQVEHDLAVTEVFLRRGRGADWRLEDVFAAGEFGAKVPDAVVADGTGGTTVIEIGGQYSAARLEGFHHAMARLDLPYELW